MGGVDPWGEKRNGWMGRGEKLRLGEEEVECEDRAGALAS